MRKYIPQEIAALKQQKYIIFTEFELDLLAKGEGTFKLDNQADKALEKFRSHLQIPMARGESMITFLTRQEFQQHHGKLNDRLVFLTKALIKKGVITEAEINLVAHEMIAEGWVHLCEKCVHDFAQCKVSPWEINKEPKRAIDIFPDLTDALADKVIQCDKYEEKVEGIKKEIQESEKVITEIKGGVKC
jgi:hypothetical protein